MLKRISNCKLCPNRITTRSKSGLCGDCNRKQTKNRKEPYRWLYNLLCHQALARGIEVSLSFQEFIFLTDIGSCCYCGEHVIWQEYSNRKTARTNLDRTDNAKGYSLDNVVVCCADCNTRKSNWLTQDEFQLVMDLLRVYRGESENGRRELSYTINTWRQ